MYAYHTPNNYTVYFNANSGNTPNPTSKTVTYDSTYGTLASITKKGHTFNGWYTAASGGTKIEPSTKVSITDNQTLYAQWTPITYRVTVNVARGTGTTTLDIVFGTTTTVTVKPNAGRYNAAGYYLSSVSCTNGYTISGASTGRSAIGTQTLTINNNNNDTNATCSVTYTTLDYSASPYCEGGRTLSGGNCTYYYSNNEGKCGCQSYNSCQHSDCGSTINTCQNAACGYTWSNWSVTGSCGDVSSCGQCDSRDDCKTGNWINTPGYPQGYPIETLTRHKINKTCQTSACGSTINTCQTSACGCRTGNSCTKTENEYRRYSCPSGGSLSGTSCLY